MGYKYSVQFEKFGEDSKQLLCSTLKLSDNFCTMFPISSSLGYVDYKETPSSKTHPFQQFWFSIIYATNEIDAIQEAIISLVRAQLEKNFPIHLPLVHDDCLVKEF
jgi:hypothetical protein